MCGRCGTLGHPGPYSTTPGLYTYYFMVNTTVYYYHTSDPCQYITHSKHMLDSNTQLRACPVLNNSLTLHSCTCICHTRPSFPTSGIFPHDGYHIQIFHYGTHVLTVTHRYLYYYTSSITLPVIWNILSFLALFIDNTFDFVSLNIIPYSPMHTLLL